MSRASAGVDVVQEIKTSDAEFADVQEQFRKLMMDMDASRAARVHRTEASLRSFLVKTLAAIAESLGFVVANLAEFVADLKWSWKSGWEQGRERARLKRVRPSD